MEQTSVTITPVELARLEQALRAMPSQDRELFLAHRLDAMSYPELAQVTGLGVAQIEQRIARAMLAIDRCLACCDPGEKHR